jgi:hypothetical protein
MKINNLFYLLKNITHIPLFFWDYIKFIRGVTSWKCSIFELLPIFQDKTSDMGFDSHYVYHTGWAARILREMSPQQHIDISSSIIFCSIVSAFIPIRHYDYRTPILIMPDLMCGSQDLCNLTFLDNSIDSLSCMHVIEHIGLGRYGDPINAAGDQIAATELTRVLSPGGTLLIVLPVAEMANIRFNAHRIYSFDKVIQLFSDLELVEFSFLNEVKSNKFIRFASKKDIIGSIYGCGCFVFKKSKYS